MRIPYNEHGVPTKPTASNEDGNSDTNYIARPNPIPQFSFLPCEATQRINAWRYDVEAGCPPPEENPEPIDAMSMEFNNNEILVPRVFKGAKGYAMTLQPICPVAVPKHAGYMLKLRDNQDPTCDLFLSLCGIDDPTTFQGTKDASDFCLITPEQRNRVLEASRVRLRYQPTLFPVSIASKNLSAHSLYPTLGVDTTMPQFRPNSAGQLILPTQEQYPVWYFFYNDLIKVSVLLRTLGRDITCAPICNLASVKGAKFEYCCAQHFGVTEAAGYTWVPGIALEVENHHDENALRLHMTGRYEVIRCTIDLGEHYRSVKGLTFRLVRGL